MSKEIIKINQQRRHMLSRSKIQSFKKQKNYFSYSYLYSQNFYHFLGILIDILFLSSKFSPSLNHFGGGFGEIIFRSFCISPNPQTIFGSRSLGIFVLFYLKWARLRNRIFFFFFSFGSFESWLSEAENHTCYRY